MKSAANWCFLPSNWLHFSQLMPYILRTKQKTGIIGEMSQRSIYLSVHEFLDKWWQKSELPSLGFPEFLLEAVVQNFILLETKQLTVQKWIEIANLKQDVMEELYVWFKAASPLDALEVSRLPCLGKHRKVVTGTIPPETNTRTRIRNINN